ncbi:DUF3396 domain-containing protein [Stenotrophomonas maltophilia]|uniref:DUF3396 domain-containing protein n=1 Tax=Stenotrophomonas maltophilia TaxID=40324 RepID=A0AA89WA46_STEMA|nr:type VI immunity family protein [Stenotrophomonas maltophilia]MBH1654416.1 DUF3396 domain-containing protein [Stenotrophomonas maltophilia]HDS1509838.1 DUF3396 domain-containing protein [Stenotrophomonas maltophilia]
MGINPSTFVTHLALAGASPFSRVTGQIAETPLVTSPSQIPVEMQGCPEALGAQQFPGDLLLPGGPRNYVGAVICLRLTLYFKDAHTAATRRHLCLCFDAFCELAGDALSWLWREKPKRGMPKQRVKNSKSLRDMIENMSEDDHLSFCYTSGAMAQDAGAWKFLIFGARGWEARIGSDMSVLELSVPISCLPTQREDFVELAAKCARWLSAEHGHAGYAVNMSEVRRERNEPVEAILAQRYPGLDAGCAPFLANQPQLAHLKIKTVSWLTLLDHARLEAAGGLDQLRSALPEQHFSLHDYGHGVMIQAGPRPLALVDAGDPRPPAYVLLDHQLRGIRPASVGSLHFNPKSAEPRLVGRLADQWMGRFEVDASEISTHEERLAQQHPLSDGDLQDETPFVNQSIAREMPQ